MIDKADILAVTKSVTKKWTKQRKSEERNLRSRSSRAYMHSGRVNFTDIAHLILPDAYQHASGGGRMWVKKRQLYYAAREKLRELTGRVVDANYFSQNLLRKYMNTHPETSAWKIAADARGHLIVPNAGHQISVPIGTLEIADHLNRAQRDCDWTDIAAARIGVEWPSIAAGQRYQAVLFIEKEGFAPLLEEARIAERFDIAILSGKGQSTEAARRFVDEVCRINGGVPLYILHDFDKAGFQIAIRLTTVGEWAVDNDMVLYEFQNEVNATDLGLRLDDVNAYDLHWAAEQAPCNRNGRCKCFRCQPLDQSEYGVTDEEYKFLASGRRVELNALTSPQFIELIESKLTQHGLNRRLIPTDDVLADAYRHALATAEINRTLSETCDSAIDAARQAEIPRTLRKQLQQQMHERPEPWDKVLYRLAESKLSETDDG